MSEAQSPAAWWTKMALVLDPYERQARLYPALLVLFPTMVSVVALYGRQLLALKGVGALVSAVGLVYLLCDIARSKGKANEKALWVKWGGTPSIQMLRHRDNHFDPVSKQRYQDLLAKKIKVVFPSRDAELTDPVAADATYSAAGNWLREATRDKKKFGLLFRENVTYGYRRNGFGLRWLGLTVCAVTAGWVLVRLGFKSWAERLAVAATPEAFLSSGEVAALGAAVFMAAIWLFYFSEARVRQAAFAYAERLILACEVLPAGRAPSVSKASQPGAPD